MKIRNESFGDDEANRHGRHGRRSVRQMAFVEQNEHGMGKKVGGDQKALLLRNAYDVGGMPLKFDHLGVGEVGIN